MIFQSDLSAVYSNRLTPYVCHLVLRSIATDMAGVESFEEIVGTREAAAVTTESGEMATTDDATVGDEAAATGEIMYADEGPYTIDVRHIEAMVGTTREAADGDRVRRGRDGDETGDEPGGPRDETDNKTAATAGDKRDSGDRWDNVYGRRRVRI